MYTKLQQSKVKYKQKEDLKTVLEKHQNDLNLIKFEVQKNYRPVEIKSLADAFYYWSIGTRTVFLDGSSHCRQGAYRSDLDLFLLCRYYFSMSYEKFIKYFNIFENMSFDSSWGKCKIIQHSYCDTIIRRVYYARFNSVLQGNQIKELLNKEFGKVKLKISKIPNIGEKIL